MPHKTSNLLKDMEYDARVLKEEICENLDEENDKEVNDQYHCIISNQNYF